MESYIEFKDSFKHKTGLGYGVDYTAAYLNATADRGWQNASGGMLRLYVNWDIVNRNTLNSGALIFKVEHRHRYDSLPPAELGTYLEYAGILIKPSTNEGFRLTNFYWRQRLLDGKLSFIVGLLDPTDYLDAYVLTSPWTGFMNSAFSTGSQIMYIPNDAALGAAVAGYLSNNVYLMAGITDAWADPTKPWKSFETFFTNKDYFTSIEVGFVSQPDRFIFDNIHATYWHSNGSEVTGSKAGWGMAFSASWFFAEKWLPFIRGGFARDGGTLFQKSLSTGFGYQRKPHGSVLGFGFNWGEANESTLQVGPKDQYTLEFFYRAQLSSRIAITPDVQLLINPALKPISTTVFLWGVRARLVL